MQLKVTNENYSATVVKIKKLMNLEGCDNLLGVPMMGLQALVSKDYKEGELYIMFPAEVQLSNDFCKNNNLYRHSDLNSNTESKGYIEDNRRVKAVKLRGHVSSALLVPLNFLSYLDNSYGSLKEGDSFNEINGVEVCKKYELEFKGARLGNRLSGKNKRFEKIDNKTFPEHLDSDNFWKNAHRYNENDRIVVTQKLHGTSARFGYVRTRRQLSWFERILRWLGVKVDESIYDNIYGSRKVIKNGSISNDGYGFYDNDVRKIISDRYKDVLPKDYIIYGEIIGRDGQKAIQKNYTYGLPEGELELYVYRISLVNEDGFITDLSWDAIKQFCTNTGMKHVPEMWIGVKKDLDIDSFMDRRYNEEGYGRCLPLSHNTLPDEGVIVRREGIVPFLCKAKSSGFLQHETNMLDEGIIDIESEQSI